MYHPLAIVVSLGVLGELKLYNMFFQLTTSLLITIIFAAISYKFLERPFIKLKIKYSKVLSRENVKVI